MTTLYMVFPAFLANHPPKALAIARNVKQTPKQYVINEKDVELVHTGSNGQPHFRGKARFWKDGLHCVGQTTDWLVVPFDYWEKCRARVTGEKSNAKSNARGTSK